jgi:short-subunit dehydrogenase
MITGGKTALVTGASAGIGETFARHLAQNGFRLVLVARRADKLADLAQRLSSDHGVECVSLAADLSAPKAVSQLLKELEKRNLGIDFLVNNAGMSGSYQFADVRWSELAAEIQVMITSLTELAHGVVPGMKARGWGRIVNVSSIAAYAPPAASLLYTGIKSYVLNVSQSMDMELKPHGIHVTALCPGFTRTEFHQVMGTSDTASKIPNFMWQSSRDVVQECYSAVMSGKPVCVPGWINKLTVAGLRPVPEVVRYQLGLKLNPFK